jgi:hypothetical protein
MGSHHSTVTGGAFGSSPTAPGTNSAGTALSSSGGSGAAIKGPALGTGDPVVDREDKAVGRMVQIDLQGMLRRLSGTFRSIGGVRAPNEAQESRYPGGARRDFNYFSTIPSYSGVHGDSAWPWWKVSGASASAAPRPA